MLEKISGGRVAKKKTSSNKVQIAPGLEKIIKEAKGNSEQTKQKKQERHRELIVWTNL